MQQAVSMPPVAFLNNTCVCVNTKKKNAPAAMLYLNARLVLLHNANAMAFPLQKMKNYLLKNGTKTVFAENACLN